jgi:hypothetical protein
LPEHRTQERRRTAGIISGLQTAGLDVYLTNFSNRYGVIDIVATGSDEAILTKILSYTAQSHRKPPTSNGEPATVPVVTAIVGPNQEHQFCLSRKRFANDTTPEPVGYEVRVSLLTRPLAMKLYGCSNLCK